MLKVMRWVGALAFVGAATACGPAGQNTAQSIAQERAQAQQLVQELREKDALVQDPQVNRYVDGIVQRIAAQRPPGAVPLESYVVADAGINAFTTGGGYLFFNAGLLAALENEAQVATVAAHEIAHIDRGHVTAGRQTNQTIALIGALAGTAASVVGYGGELAELGINVGQNLAASSFSRAQERDADEIGFRYAAEAGYDMSEGADAFEVMRRVYGERGGVAAFFASHPQSSERQAELERMARRMPGGDYVGEQAHDRALAQLRRDVLQYLESQGRDAEAAQIRRVLAR